MNAAGRPFPDGALHFISNYAYGAKGWTGYVNFTFQADVVAIIYANVDGPAGQPQDMEFIWNVSLPGCSDFPGREPRCASR